MIDYTHFFETGLMWSIYNDMEVVLMEFLGLVPPTEDHAEVYSYSLLRLMLQIGGYIDTTFKAMAFYSKFDGNAKCEDTREKVNKDEIITIDDFRETFEPIYDLSSNTIVAKSPMHFSLVVARFNPFLEFSKGETPKWWTAYNKVKHNLVKNQKEANLENTLKALGGAFLLNVIHEPSLLELARRGIAKTFLAGWRQVRFSEELLSRLIKREQPVGDKIIMVDTQLFRWRLI